MKPRLRALVFINLACAGTSRVDEVTDWNEYMFQAAKTAGSSPVVMARLAAIVQSSMFDAVNGIDRH